MNLNRGVASLTFKRPSPKLHEATATRLRISLPQVVAPNLRCPLETRARACLKCDAMAIEYEMRDGALVWIKNPVTGVISYVVDVRGKSFAFTLGARDELDPAAPRLGPDEIAKAQAACPFCPGNETMAPAEIFRVTPAEFPQWKGDGTAQGTGAGAAWVMRVFNNLFPRVPAE